MEEGRIIYDKCSRSNDFLAESNPQKAGIGLEIADSHILPFTVKQEQSFSLLHDSFESNVAGRLYDQNPKNNTKFDYSCAELYYERYHKEQDQNNKLDNSKVRAPAS